jgi:2-polyprenyl-3-methyl-5-hydroxy-6-metoxy-1,4-benzoquinol methylase
MTKSQEYPLGYSEDEARRLAEQAAMLEELTADVFRRAGIERGMQVLDIGCGVGDVSFLAASMVGTEGSVLGIDRSASSVETARIRGSSRGVHNVFFKKSELAAFETDRTFDAMIGRLVLLYVPEPAAVLRRLSRYVKPGGIIAFQEFDISRLSQCPPSEVFEQMRNRIQTAFTASGTELDMGTKLYSTFLLAGLPAPTMNAVAPVGGGPKWYGYDYMVGVLRSLLPLIERSGIASPSDIGIDTLAKRLLDDAVANQRVNFLPRVIGAWTRIGQ